MKTPRQRQKPGIARSEQARRDEEVLRANKELAAYFKGNRTEREARSALKIIKAFVRGREEVDPKSRPPLPGLRAPRTAKKPATRKISKPRPRRPRTEEMSPVDQSPPATTPE